MLKSQGLIVTGGGNGNPLQYSCLENPMDRGAWQAIVHRVAKSQTWLKWLNMTIIFIELIAILCIPSTVFRWSISASLFSIPYSVKPLNCLWWLWQNFSHMSFSDQYVLEFSFSHCFQFQVHSEGYLSAWWMITMRMNSFSLPGQILQIFFLFTLLGESHYF